MVHDVLEALKKAGFTEYNKDIEELVEQIIKNNSDKNRTGKKKSNKRSELNENKEDKDIKEDMLINTKEKIE